MFELYEGRTADEAWLKIAADVRAGEKYRLQDSRDGEKTLELLHAVLSIAKPRERWVISRHRPLNLTFALAEVVWMLNGRDDARFVTYFNSQLPRFVGTDPHLHGAYGPRLCKHLGFNQLIRAYHALSNQAHSRQVVLQIWDGRIDLPSETGMPRSKDIPCNVISMLKVRDGKLEWTQVMRSNDIYKGLPYNFIQFTTLQEILAGWIGVDLGGYYHLSDSLHVYEGEDLAFVAESKPVTAEPNSDVLGIPYEESCRAWSELGRITEAVTDSVNDVAALESRLATCQLPQGFHNIARVVIAYGIRRRGFAHEADSLVAGSTNKLYRQLWQRWVESRKVASGSAEKA